MRRSGEVERSGKERPKRKGCEAVNQNFGVDFNLYPTVIYSIFSLTRGFLSILKCFNDYTNTLLIQ